MVVEETACPQDQHNSSSEEEQSIYSIPAPSQPQLLPSMEGNVEFQNLYSIQNLDKQKKMLIAKSFIATECPEFLRELGDVSLDSAGKWALSIPQCLIAQVAGYDLNLDRQLYLSSDTVLFEDIFELLCKKNVFIWHPCFPDWYRKQYDDSWVILTLKNQIKALSAAWVMATQALNDGWKNVSLMTNVILPSVRHSLEGLKNFIRFLRVNRLPKSMPRDVKRKFVELPFSAVWPLDEIHINLLKPIFRRAPSKKGGC